MYSAVLAFGLRGGSPASSTVGLAAVDFPRVTVGQSLDSETLSWTDSEVASRAGDDDPPRLFKISVVCADESACIETLGDMFEPRVMWDDAGWHQFGAHVVPRSSASVSTGAHR